LKGPFDVETIVLLDQDKSLAHILHEVPALDELQVIETSDCQEAVR
jgi:hypothetical protein